MTVFLLLAGSLHAETPSLYTLDEALSKGVVSPRMSLFNGTDQSHVLDSIADLDPGISFASYVGVWGVIRQQDLNIAGQLATQLRQKLPRTILGGGVNESVSLSAAPQALVGRSIRLLRCARRDQTSGGS